MIKNICLTGQTKFTPLHERPIDKVVVKTFIIYIHFEIQKK